MRRFTRFLIPFFCLAIVGQSVAQSVYTGTRVALFELQVLQQKGQNLNIRCRMANTGREILGSKQASREMLVEFDTSTYPSLLRGHENEIIESVRDNCPKLKPGELSEPIWLTVRLNPPGAPDSLGCAEIKFDTVFVEAWDAHKMRLRYLLKNTGNAAAHFYAKKTEPLLNVYFVSGEKLTRGAIRAGSTSIQKGRETLDGVLQPGQILEGVVTIDLENRTRFSPNIALEFDPAQAVDECERIGNVWVVKLRF